MNSDSPGKHSFARNVARGGVGEWRRRSFWKGTDSALQPFSAAGTAKEPTLGSAARHSGTFTVGGHRWAGTDLHAGHAFRDGDICPLSVSKGDGRRWPYYGHPINSQGVWVPGGEVGSGIRWGQLGAPRGRYPNVKVQCGKWVQPLGSWKRRMTRAWQNLAKMLRSAQDIWVQVRILWSCPYLQAICPILAPQPPIIPAGTTSRVCPAPPSMFEA